MRAFLLFLVVVMVSWPLNAVGGGPNDGGTLILHANTSLVYTSDPTGFVLLGSGPCGTDRFETKDDGWPGPGAGVGMSWRGTRAGMTSTRKLVVLN